MSKRAKEEMKEVKYITDDSFCDTVIDVQNHGIMYNDLEESLQYEPTDDIKQIFKSELDKYNAANDGSFKVESYTATLYGIIAEAMDGNCEVIRLTLPVNISYTIDEVNIEIEKD